MATITNYGITPPQSASHADLLRMVVDLNAQLGAMSIEIRELKEARKEDLDLGGTRVKNAASQSRSLNDAVTRRELRNRTLYKARGQRTIGVKGKLKLAAPPIQPDAIRGNQSLPLDQAQGLLDVLEPFPVGAIYLNVTGVNPGTELGYGTWTAFGSGQMLTTFKNADPDFGVVENTGGSKTASHDHNHDGAAVADHADHVHTGPAAHPEASNAQGASAGDVVTDGVHGDTGGATTTLSHTITQPAAHSDHNILNPFIVVYAWKRTV